ncbi:hypothetical protein FACS189432_01820 [Bacteroidia bacterium]|nr:hypothetical protein FACS189432_01820 [Bacteroidia bacterium]GHV71905.1 hypothetical protein FACS189420_8360 [Bacteroidia bacterium]
MKFSSIINKIKKLKKDMDKTEILIIASIIILAAAIILYTISHFRWIISKKNRSLVHHLVENACLEKKLERTRIEKEAMEKLITDNLKNAQQASGAEEEEDNR